MIARFQLRDIEIFSFHRMLGFSAGYCATLMFDLVGCLLRKLSQCLSESVEIDGLWIAASEREMLSKARDALLLIKTHDPRRYARIVSDLNGVWVTLLTGPIGQFQYSDYMCELDERFVARMSQEEIASVIVHEAAHARLWRRGVRYSENVRQRVEAICFRREQAFASRLPRPEERAEQLAAYLDLPAAVWSDDSFRRNHVRGSVAALRHLNAPHWLIGFLLRRERAKRRRLRRSSTARTISHTSPDTQNPSGDRRHLGGA